MALREDPGPIGRAIDFLFDRSSPILAALAVLITLVATLADAWSGQTLRLVVWYLIAVLMVAWAYGRAAGLVLALVGPAMFAFPEYAAGAGSGAAIAVRWLVEASGFALCVIVLVALRQALERARYSSREDALTGLANKAGFYQVVRSELEKSRRYRRPLTIAYIDLDNFKAVNDRHGHHIGDNLLTIVARTMRRRLRSSDLPARLGGDEFAILLPETGAVAAMGIVSTLHARLNEAMREHRWPVTFSTGIATFLRMPRGIDDLIREADELMYGVKHTRKGEIRQQVFGGTDSDTIPPPPGAGAAERASEAAGRPDGRSAG